MDPQDFTLRLKSKGKVKVVSGWVVLAFMALGSHGLPASQESIILGQASPVAHLGTRKSDDKISYHKYRVYTYKKK